MNYRLYELYTKFIEWFRISKPGSWILALHDISVLTYDNIKYKVKE